MTAPSGAEGLEVADTIRPAAVLCDYTMPGMSGLDVLEGLRGNVSTRDVPFILMAGGLDKLPGTTLNHPHDIILKPFGAGQVVQAVTRVLAD
jgi:CheY-like chemotaxis protein